MVQLIGIPPLAVPEHPEEYVVVYPSAVDDETLYFPACNVTGVPADEPENDAGFGLFPETLMVKSEGFLVPPLVLSTLVITLKNVVDPGGGPVYLLVTVHLMVRPSLILPEHPEEYVVVYPSAVDDEALYFPACNVTEVPADEPENDAGFGSFPETLMVKSEDVLSPPDTVAVTINVPNNPGDGIGRG